MAAENGIDLALVHGTGKDGRILKEDVINYQQNITTQQTSKPMPIRISQPVNGDYIESIIGVPRAMVNKMKEAVDVPIFGYGEEIILNNLVKLRPEMKRISSEYNIRVSYMSFFIKATSMALQSPNARILNAHVNKECTEIHYKSDHNIGIAIDTADGLVVANIKQCQLKSILEIAESLQILVDKARNSSLTSDDISGGTITLSNVGAIGGGTYCHPICFVPEVCIAAFGAMKEHPRYDSNGEIYKAQVMPVQWSADHRVIDGATMARFCNEWKGFLENPQHMLMHMR